MNPVQVPSQIPAPAPAPSTDSNNTGDTTKSENSTSAGDLSDPPPLPQQWLPANVSTLSGLILSGIAPGVPGIDAPPSGCAQEDLMDFIGRLVGKTQEGQLRVTREGLKMNQKKLDEMHAKAMDQIHTWIKKCKDADKNSHTSNALKWFKRIAMPVAAALAVALSVATAGATSGIAAVAIAMCVYSMAQDISSEAGGPDLSLADNLTKGFTQMFEKFGLPKDEAEKAGKLLSGAVGSLVVPGMAVLDPKFAGQLASGVASEAGTGAAKAEMVDTAFTMAMTLAVAIGTGVAGYGKAGAAAGKLGVMGARLALAGGISQVTLTAANGATSAADGGLAIETAGAQRDADKAQADTKRTNAGVRRMQAQQEQDLDTLKKVAQQIDDVFLLAGDVLNDAARSNAQMIDQRGRQVV